MYKKSEGEAMKDRFDVDAEEICGYQVSSGRKKLWVAEMDMLDCLEKTCLENGINYFLFAGSAIGVVRHKGFIPWDDDIDIGMLREDFEKFLKAEKKDWPDYYSIQYGLSENRCDILLRIRDSRTTGITAAEIDSPGNKGCFIEIYPFDYVEDNWIRKVQNKVTAQLLREINTRIACTRKQSQTLSLSAKIRYILLKVFTNRTLWNIYISVCKIQNKRKEKVFVDTPALPAYAMTGEHLYRYEDVKSSIYMPFEYMTARVPIGYDHCLTVAYGDYMELPPVEKRGVHHNDQVFYDAEKPYSIYENEKKDIIERYFAGDYSLSRI